MPTLWFLRKSHHRVYIRLFTKKLDPQLGWKTKPHMPARMANRTIRLCLLYGLVLHAPLGSSACWQTREKANLVLWHAHKLGSINSNDRDTVLPDHSSLYLCLGCNHDHSITTDFKLFSWTGRDWMADILHNCLVDVREYPLHHSDYLLFAWRQV